MSQQINRLRVSVTYNVFIDRISAFIISEIFIVETLENFQYTGCIDFRAKNLIYRIV